MANVQLQLVFTFCGKMIDKRATINYYRIAMRDWRNGQTRTFKWRVGDRVSSSLTSRTKKENHKFFVVFFFFIYMIFKFVSQ